VIGVTIAMVFTVKDIEYDLQRQGVFFARKGCGINASHVRSRVREGPFAKNINIKGRKQHICVREAKVMIIGAVEKPGGYFVSYHA